MLFTEQVGSVSGQGEPAAMIEVSAPNVTLLVVAGGRPPTGSGIEAVDEGMLDQLVITPETRQK